MEKRMSTTLACILYATLLWGKTATINGVTWSYTTKVDGEETIAVITGPSPKSGKLTVPAELPRSGGYPVREIAEDAFASDNDSITEVVFPESMRRIGKYAFEDCRNLERVTFNEGLVTIGHGAFDNCSKLGNVTIPSTVEEEVIFPGAYLMTAITVADGNPYFKSIDGIVYSKDGSRLVFVPAGLTGEWTVPGQVTEIGDEAFTGGSLSCVTIHAGVSKISEDAAFGWCVNLTHISVAGGNANYKDVDGVLFSRDGTCLMAYPAGKKDVSTYTVPRAVTRLCDAAFGGSSLSGIILPSTVRRLPTDLFCDCTNLTSVTIPNSVTNIGHCAFENCSGLTSIAIPNSVMCIENDAFEDCTGLTSVTIPDSVTQIGEWVFDGCTGIKTVTIPQSVCSVGMNKVFPSSRTTITKVVVSANVTRIGYAAFSGFNNIRDVTVPQSVLDAGPNQVFNSYSSITNVSYSSNVTNISSDAFWGWRGLTSVTIPNNVKSIGARAFNYCSNLKSVTIGDGVLSVGDYAFESCSKLVDVTIPNSVTSIGECAFWRCSGLTSVTILGSVTNFGYKAFGDCSKLASVTIGHGVKEIGNYAFSGCSGLTSVTIPDSVTSIGYEAFSWCSGLKSITIPNSVTNIDSHAFYGCTNLTVDIPVGTIDIRDSAFSGCGWLASVTIPDSVMRIGSYAFSGCSGLTSVTIPNNVKSIGALAFNYCSNLKSVTIGHGVKEIGDSAFSGCSGLTSVTIPNSVTSIGQYAFSGCSGLTSVEMPNSVTSIGSSAFSGCSGLTSVTIPDSVTSIGDSPFYGCSGVKNVTVPQSALDAQLKNVFGSCYSSITNVSYSSTITNISAEAFWGCSGLTSVEIPTSVTTIGNYAFSGCSGLTSVTIPNSVTTIGFCAFWGCSGLENVTFLGEVPEGVSSSYILSNASSVRYPKKYASMYEQFVPSSQFGGYVGVEDFLNFHGEFVNDETKPWDDDCSVSHDRQASMRSGNIGNNESTWIELTVNGTGRLSFWWKASSEEYNGDVFDYAYLSVDGVPQGTLDGNYRLNGIAIGGKTDWTNVVVHIAGDGSHTVRWTYCKDDVDESDVGEDCVWLDEVSFAPLVSLSYSLGGGEGIGPAPAQYYAGTSVALPTGEGLSWGDHEFGGWSDGNTDYASGSIYTVPASNVTFVAKWIAKRFLTFMLDGGDGDVPAIIKSVPGATVNLPASNGFSKPKYRFVGWSDGTKTYDAGAKYVVTDSSVEFTAVWVANTLVAPTITSADVANGGTIETAGTTINIAADNGTVIYYTLDGTDPTTGSMHYTAPFSANGMSVRIRAIAVKDNYFDSPVADFSFTRKPYSAAECLNAEGTFATGGSDVAWGRVLGEAAHDGVAAMRSGVIGDSGTSSIEMTVEGTGEIGFWWKSSSEISRNRKYDYVSFLIDGEEQSWLGGEKDWTNEVFTVSGSGTHTLKWVYQKNDNGQTQGEDCAWLDEVTWIPGGYVVDASVTGGNAIRVNEEWVTSELDERFGAGKRDAFVAKFGNDIAAALTKKTGKIDAAGKELAVWHDFVAGTDPTDVNSTFKAKIEIRDGMPIIEWEPNLNEGGEVRTYTIYGMADLKDEWHSPTNALDRFFKVDVAMPVDGTVTFNVGGGAVIDPMVVRVGQPIGTLPTPTRQGYDFLGWFTKAEDGTAITPETTVTDDLTIYAHWERKIAPDLVHRWSFNGDLTDSVGGQTAAKVGSVTAGATQYTLAGGASGSSYINLGANVLPNDGSPVTLEMWVTQHSYQYYARIWDFGNTKDEDMYMGLFSTDSDRDAIVFRNSGVVVESSLLAPYTAGTEFYIAVVMTPLNNGRWKLDFYKKNSSGTTLRSYSATTTASSWTLQGLTQSKCYLGHAIGDAYDANASYNEFRVWKKAMTESELTASAIAGPDANL